MSFKIDTCDVCGDYVGSQYCDRVPLNRGRYLVFITGHKGCLQGLTVEESLRIAREKFVKGDFTEIEIELGERGNT